MPEAKPKLLVLGSVPPPVNGATVYFETLLGTQVAQQFDVRFLNLKFYEAIGDSGRFSLKKVIRLMICTVRLCFILMRFRVDLVYAAISFNKLSFTKDIILVMLCRLFGRKVVACILGIGLEELYHRSGWLSKRFIRYGLSLYSIFISPSRQMYEKHFAKLVPLQKERTVPFGIFTDADAFSRRLLNPSDPIRVIFYSNLIKSKGTDEAVRAVSLVSQQHPNVRFLFVGAWDSEVHRNAVMDIVKAEKIQNYVEFRGVVHGEERKACLQTSDIFLLPTYYQFEGLPLSILEAMSYGCAIIATDHSAISAALTDGVNGLFCRPGDPDDIAQKIGILVEDRQLLLKMQENGARKFRELFTAQRFGATLATELLSLCETP